MSGLITTGRCAVGSRDCILNQAVGIPGEVEMNRNWGGRMPERLRGARGRQIVRLIVLVFVSVPLGAAGVAAQRPTPEVRAWMLSIPSDSVEFMVAGRVVSSEDGKVIPGAQVFLAGSTLGTRTDLEGLFRLDAPAPGPAELRVRLIGYVEVCVRVDLLVDTMRSLRIELSRVPSSLPPSVGIRGGCIDPETEDPPPSA